MTREEAKMILEEVKIMDDSMYQYNTKYLEALDMAIEALEQLTSYEQTINKLTKAISEQEPCDDAISRQAVLDGIDTYISKSQSTGTQDDFYSFAELVVKVLPSVNPQKLCTNCQVEEKTGHWRAQDIHNCHTDFKCSECGYIHSFMHLYGKPTADYTYCPNCGARMENEEC